MEDVKVNKWIDYINNEQIRNNAESLFVAIAAVAVVIITKGYISGFSWALFFTLDPYASGIGVGVATSIIQNNMIDRAIPDEVEDNEKLAKVLTEVADLDMKITDYDYAEFFLDGYNKNEFARLQKKASNKELRRLKYLISMKKSLGRKYVKLQRKLDYVNEYGAKVKNYSPVSLQDLLSFNAESELTGKDKVNYNPIKSLRKRVAKSRVKLFIASGFMAGLPIVSGKNGKELFIFLCLWIPLLGITALRTYINSRKIAKTTYYKSLQYKKNVLQLCIDNYKHWTPPSEPVKQDVKEVLQIKGEVIK